MTNRAALLAVCVAFATGLLASLALRPPGEMAAETSQPEGNTPSSSRLNWRIPVAFNSNLPGLGDNILYVAEALGKATGGRLQFDVYEPGEIVPAFSIVDAVRDNKVEAGYTWLGYDQGKIPASALLGAVPFGLEPWEYMAWWYDGGGEELGQALYAKHGVHIMLCGIIGPETAGWFANPSTRWTTYKG